MATRSTIAVVHNDGKVSAIYCHWDGYPSHNGKLLVENYNSLELAEELISLGDMSSLGVRINPTGNDHSFDYPEEGTTVYYGRDRGEEETAPDLYSDLRMYELTLAGEEFDYIFKDGAWWLNHGKHVADKQGNRIYSAVSSKLTK